MLSFTPRRLKMRPAISGPSSSAAGRCIRNSSEEKRTESSSNISQCPIARRDAKMHHPGKGLKNQYIQVWPALQAGMPATWVAGLAGLFVALFLTQTIFTQLIGDGGMRHPSRFASLRVLG